MASADSWRCCGFVAQRMRQVTVRRAQQYLPLGVGAARHDSIEIAALQIDHFSRQATVSADPALYRSRIDIPQRLGTDRTDD